MAVFLSDRALGARDQGGRACDHESCETLHRSSDQAVKHEKLRPRTRYTGRSDRRPACIAHANARSFKCDSSDLERAGQTKDGRTRIRDVTPSAGCPGETQVEDCKFVPGEPRDCGWTNHRCDAGRDGGRSIEADRAHVAAAAPIPTNGAVRRFRRLRLRAAARSTHDFVIPATEQLAAMRPARKEQRREHQQCRQTPTERAGHAGESMLAPPHAVNKWRQTDAGSRLISCLRTMT